MRTVVCLCALRSAGNQFRLYPAYDQDSGWDRHWHARDPHEDKADRKTDGCMDVFKVVKVGGIKQFLINYMVALYHLEVRLLKKLNTISRCKCSLDERASTLVIELTTGKYN